MTINQYVFRKKDELDTLNRVVTSAFAELDERNLHPYDQLGLLMLIQTVEAVAPVPSRDRGTKAVRHLAVLVPQVIRELASPELMGAKIPNHTPGIIDVTYRIGFNELGAAGLIDRRSEVIEANGSVITAKGLDMIEAMHESDTTN